MKKHLSWSEIEKYLDELPSSAIDKIFEHRDIIEGYQEKLILIKEALFDKLNTNASNKRRLMYMINSVKSINRENFLKTKQCIIETSKNGLQVFEEIEELDVEDKKLTSLIEQEYAKIEDIIKGNVVTEDYNVVTIRVANLTKSASNLLNFLNYKYK